MTEVLPRRSGLGPRSVLRVALRMLWQNRVRGCLSLLGVGVAFLLAGAQTGLMVGWMETVSAIPRHAGGDLWVAARKTPSFDFGQPIPRALVHVARSVEGVEWAEGMFIAWHVWQRSDGEQPNVQMVGLDEARKGGPWDMREGRIEALDQPHAVIVDRLYEQQLGADSVGNEVEIYGRRARIVGKSFGVRTFTTSPFVFADLDEALKYDLRFRDDEISYVIVGCRPGSNKSAVKAGLERLMPDQEIMTRGEMIRRTVAYWMLETGVGVSVVITALLGLVVGVVIMSQTLYAVTLENLHHYAALMAMGFSRGRLILMVLSQALCVAGGGILIGLAILLPVSLISDATPVVVRTNPHVLLVLAVGTIGSCAAAAFLSIRPVLRVDPVSVFQGT